ncbi:unnamed protein product, partial [Prorocentrum cordatum]
EHDTAAPLHQFFTSSDVQASSAGDYNGLALATAEALQGAVAALGACAAPSAGNHGIAEAAASSDADLQPGIPAVHGGMAAAVPSDEVDGFYGNCDTSEELVDNGSEALRTGPAAAAGGGVRAA